jgi:Ni/Co efflux regulator RcnB
LKNITLTFALSAALLASPMLAVAQRDDHGDQHDQRDQEQHHDDGGHSDYHFRQQDAPRLHQQYREADHYREARDRHAWRAGDRLPSDWHSRIRPVPEYVYRELPPPPPGYVFGYMDGYAVAYNPTTQIIADVLDLATVGAHAR